jgi:hypothetical protein
MSSERKNSLSSVRSDVSWIKDSSRPASSATAILQSENKPENIEVSEVSVLKQVSQYREGNLHLSIPEILIIIPRTS